mgnify:CR=1 FL=1
MFFKFFQFFFYVINCNTARLIYINVYTVNIFNQSFVSFNLGYGAAMSLALLAILVLISIFQLWLLRVGEDRS